MIKLRDYQEDLSKNGNLALLKCGLVYLAVEVRVGKTLTALNIAKLYGSKNVLFLTKKKAIGSIQKDFDEFEPGFNIQVKNYEQLKHINFQPDLLILDEAHCLGAFPKSSLRTKFLRDKFYKVPVIFLSGTPTPESYSQIFHQLWITQASPYNQYKNFYQWAKDYVKTKQRRMGTLIINDYSDADGERIKKDIAPFFLSFTQLEAKFKCNVTEEVLYVDTPISHILRLLRRDRLMEFEAGTTIADTPSGLMNKMHQISGGTCICEKNGEKTVQIVFKEKIQFISRRFAGKRIAIYYKFKAERELIKEYYPDSTESVEFFASGKSNTFICQVQSGREGISLVSADALVFYNIDYSATSYWQARARMQDLKRTTPALVYWIFSVGGYEKEVYKAVRSKKDFTYSYFKRNFPW